MTDFELSQPRTETPIDETDNDLCRALWLGVAIQAMIDATSKSRKKAAIKARSEALQWLAEISNKQSDFAMVCDLAGISCEKLREKFRSILRNPNESVDFRCLKKAGIDNRGTESRSRYFARSRKNKLIRERRLAEQLQPDAAPCSIFHFHPTPESSFANRCQASR